jgi:hypothetical protein
VHRTLRVTQRWRLTCKAGKLYAPYVRDLRGVVEGEQAAVGVLLTLDESTKAIADRSGLRRLLQVAVGPAPTDANRDGWRTTGRPETGHSARPADECHLQAGTESTLESGRTAPAL